MILSKYTLLKNNKKIFLYIVWGIIGMILNIGLFRLLLLGRMDYQIANFVTLFIVKIFTYITNKLFVFRTPFANLKYCLKEAGAFLLARGATFIFDFTGVIIMVEAMGLNPFLSKCIVAIGVIALNYILSNNFVFHKETEI